MKKLVAWVRERVSRLIATALSALVASVIVAGAIVLWSPSGGDTNMPGLTVNWPAGTYVKSAPTTPFTVTFTGAITDAVLNPSGTIATGYAYLNSTPFDGLRNCIFTTQTVTSFTPSVSAGQTLNNATTSIAANAKQCWTYSASNTTWDRSQ
jgi:hypothetical protein